MLLVYHKPGDEKILLSITINKRLSTYNKMLTILVILRFATKHFS
jgi:hypothetical protein